MQLLCGVGGKYASENKYAIWGRMLVGGVFVSGGFME